ncbi:MAG: class I SAM-dependent methyltransferase [Acidimicrobiales bacterium]
MDDEPTSDDAGDGGAVDGPASTGPRRYDSGPGKQPGTSDWDGEGYQARFDKLAAEGAEVHGEADLVSSYAPGSVLDAGCGTGRVGIELARRGVEVVGADLDPSMLATARRLAPEISWIEADLAALDLGRTFDVVVMAGNVVLFTPAGTQAAVVAGCARHVAPGGVLISGFSLGHGWSADDHDDAAVAAGLEPVDRFASWERDPWPGDGSYVVAVHRRPT